MALSTAIEDLASGMRLFRYWGYAAILKIQLENQKTSLSVLWGPLTVFFVASILSLVWAQILDVESPVDYFFYILIGFTLWSLLISRLVNRAVASLSNRSGELSLAIKPISVLSLEDIAYCFLNLFLTLPFVIIAAVYHYGLNIELMGWFVLGLVLTWVTAVGLCMTIGILAYFYRDILHLIKAFMRLGFLVTPIIWKPERLGEYAYLVWYNPFHSYIDFCRAPLMGQMPHPNSIMIVFAITLTLSVLGLIALSMSAEKIRLRVFS